MARLKTLLIWISGLAMLGYAVVCCYLYWQQEAFIFHPTKLEPEHQYTFTGRFEETSLNTAGATTNVVRFFADEPRGVILYLHGNGKIILFTEGIAAYFVSIVQSTLH